MNPFDIYTALLLDWNARIDLTAITDPVDIELKHYRDSLSISKYIPNGASFADIGSGAGFPGVPIAIERPDISVTLIESTRKRVAFLYALVEALGLGNVRIIHARAEELAKDMAHRESYDYACARAVALLPALCELCLPFVRQGGSFIALKGSSAHRETAQAAALINNLGGGLASITPANIDKTLNHNIVIIPKIAKTPANYPRRASRLGRA